jgi:hypothetical protein
MVREAWIFGCGAVPFDPFACPLPTSPGEMGIGASCPATRAPAAWAAACAAACALARTGDASSSSRRRTTVGISSLLRSSMSRMIPRSAFTCSKTKSITTSKTCPMSKLLPRAAPSW